MHESFAAHAKHRKHSFLHLQSGPPYAQIIIDAQSGRVLSEQNADASLFPASLTKIMTLFLTFEAIQNHRLFMDKYLDVSDHAVNQAPSRLGLKVDDRITVQQAIQAVVTRSANDVAMALAETIGGTEANFTRMMTLRARSLGMRNSNFVNPTGLPNANQRSSARDMAILSRAMMQYFPQYYSYFRLQRFFYKGQLIETHNHLMERFPGMDGLKTGYTAGSGFNLAASAVRNNRRVIVVVFGGRTAMARDNQVAALMNDGLTTLSRSAPIQVAMAAKTTTTHPSTTQQAAIQPNTPATAQTTIQNVIATAAATPVAPTQPPANDFVRNVAVNAIPAAGQTHAASQTGQLQPLAAQIAQPAIPTVQTTAVAMAGAPTADWGIQVGAFGDPALGQTMLASVKKQLGTMLANAQPVILPIQTANGTMYRARLVGLSAENAAKACAQLTECLPFNTK